MKVLFVVNVLKGIGGIESSLLNLLDNLDPTKYEIDLCIMGNYISDTTKIPKNVKIKRGNKIIEYCCTEYKDIANRASGIEKVVISITKVIKRLIGYRPILLFLLNFMKNKEKYDIAISYSNDIYKDVYSGGCDDYIIRCVNANKKIAWIHNDARQHGLSYEICKKKYDRFDKIVNVSNCCKDIFDNIIPEYKFKSKVVTNMINLNNIEIKKSKESPYDDCKFNIITVARMDNQQKRIDRIIDTCVILKQLKIRDIRWTVIGDGPDLESLIKKAANLDVLDILKFEGRKSNPIPYIQHADLFVQTSDYEAYSMVLIEALSVETPCLCTNYESSKDIIIDGYNGIIVEKYPSRIADKILYLIENRDVLKRVKENCKISSLELNKKAIELFEDVVI